MDIRRWQYAAPEMRDNVPELQAELNTPRYALTVIRSTAEPKPAGSPLPKDEAEYLKWRWRMNQVAEWAAQVGLNREPDLWAVCGPADDPMAWIEDGTPYEIVARRHF